MGTRGTIVWILLLACVADAGPDAITRRTIKLMITGLKTYDDPADRKRLCEELGEYGADAKMAAPALVDALGDEHYAVRDAAGEALKKIGDGVIPSVIKGLKSRNAYERAGAARLCDVAFADKVGRYIPVFIEALKDKDPKVRDHCASVLGKLGEPAVGKLIIALTANPPYAGEAAARALAGSRSVSFERVEQALRTGKNPATRVGAARAIGYMGKTGLAAVPRLVEALDDPQIEVQAAAVIALGRLGDTSVIPRLVEELETPSKRLFAALVVGLREFGKAGLPEFAKALRIEKPGASRGIVLVMSQMGRVAVPTVREALQDEIPQARVNALAILGRMDPAHVRAISGDIAACLADPMMELRLEAARSLVRVGTSGNVPALKKAAADEDASVRAAVIRALGVIGGEVDSEVARARTDKDAAVRIDAAVASWQLSGKYRETLDALAKEFQAHPLPAAEALGRMGFVATRALPLLTEGAQSEDKQVARASAAAIYRIASPPLAALHRARRTKPKGDTRKAVENGLRWLKLNQRDGRWEVLERRSNSIGVSALALMAFLASHQRNDPCVAQGLDALIELQDEDGCIGSRSAREFLVMHGIATIALTEAWIMTGKYHYRRAAQRGIDFICEARNPYLVWRYEPRGGENDSHVTTWMLTALRLAHISGMRVDVHAYMGAKAWFERMTDADTGRVGYNFAGSTPPRPEGMQRQFPPHLSESMTAAGLWCRHLLGKPMLKDPLYKAGVKLCLDLRPDWDPKVGNIDLYYWNFGALAMYQDSGAAWKRWNARMSAVLLGKQKTNGSWDPIGVWGADGGRAYSTAMCTLALLTEQRYPRGLIVASKPSSAQAAALRAARKAR